MPTYKNMSSTTYVVDTINFLPLEEKKINFYIKEDDYPGLKLIDEEPIYSPVVYSETTSGNFDVLSNLTPETNLIKIITKTNAEVSFNGDSNKVLITNACPLYLRPVNKYKTITVNSGSVSIELWKGFDWRN